MESNQRFRGGKKEKIFLFMFVFGRCFNKYFINFLLCKNNNVKIYDYKSKIFFLIFFYLVSRHTFALVAMRKTKSKSLDVFLK
jgi:hypothetical protein